AEPVEAGGDGRVVNLAGSWFAAARDIGHFDLPDPGQRAFPELDEVSFADLGVVEVQVHPQVGAVDGFDQHECVGGGSEGHAGVIDGSVEVLQGEHAAGAF